MDESSMREARREMERSLQAAQDALEQLDWCIGYFHGSGKLQIAGALARNRTEIRQRLMDRPAEPTPSHPASRPQA